jgi:hypothetical protein
MATSSPSDRYVSFAGINCSGNASRVLEAIQQHLDQLESSHPWRQYFQLKLANRHALGQDELFFVGSQISQIREFLEQVHDAAALDLLEQVEEECC